MTTLKYLSQYFTTTLNVGGGIDASQTTGIILQSVAGVSDISKPGQICVSYSDPIDTGVAEWIDYTSINGSNELVGVTRGREGYSAHTHLQGATVAFVFSASHQNDIVDLLNGTEAGIKVKTALYDENGNEVIKTPATTSAVNEITVTNSATGNAVQISATGDDTNINLKLVPKGTGAILDKNDEALSPNHSLYRQALVNPLFNVWQRGTTFNASGSVPVYTADMFVIDTAAAATNYTVSQQDGTGVTGARYCLRYARNNAATNTDNRTIRQGIVTANAILMRGKKWTFSFWARCGANYSPTSSNLYFLSQYGTGTDESPSGYTGATNFASGGVVLTTTWQKFTFTSANVLPATATEVNFILYDTPTGTAGAADYYETTAWKANSGDVELALSPSSKEDDQAKCDQYFQILGDTTNLMRLGGFITTIDGGGKYRMYVPITLKTRMFKAPTVTCYSDGDTANKATVGDSGIYGGDPANVDSSDNVTSTIGVDGGSIIIVHSAVFHIVKFYLKLDASP